MFFRTVRNWALMMGFMLACLFLASALEASEKLGGTVEAVIGDKTIHLPTLRTDYKAVVEGDLVTVTVSQLFANPSTIPLNATYLFPLPTQAAVYSMEMEVGDEIIKAQIKKVEEARAVYEAAKSQGKAAALLTQHRPNMYTQKIANLMPGLPVKVTMSYVQVAPRVDGHYELVMSLVVGPRYQPAGAGEGPDLEDGAARKEKAPQDGPAPTPISVDESRQTYPQADRSFGVWELESLPAYPLVAGLNLPKSIEEDRVSIEVVIKAGQPIAYAGSPTHALTEQRESEREMKLSLTQGRTIDNCDFILSWSLGGDKSQAGLLSHYDERGGFFSLLIEPPASPKSEDLIPREMVFVLDTSGSMGGAPLNACKSFMRQALATLNPGDYFRIITFNNEAREFGTGAVKANSANLDQAQQYVESLRANGGTEADKAIHQAFTLPQTPGTLRLVVFLTDGYLGNEATVLASINRMIGQARILSFGVGSSVNRYLLEEMGKAGRGWARFLDPGENVEEVAGQLAARLDDPILTDISIDWGGLEVGELSPSVVPDLFAGQSIRIMGRYEKGGDYVVTVNGLVGDRRASMPLKLSLPGQAVSAESQAIALVWARETVADLRRQFARPERMRPSGLSDDELKQRITTLGLIYNLVTPWTSFVAVSEKKVNTQTVAKDAQVPLPMVKNVGPGAYGQNPPPVSQASFGGNGTPEPGTLGGLALMTAAAWAALRRRRC